MRNFINLVFFIAMYFCNAQINETYTFAGVLLDQVSREPISDATLIIKQVNQYVVTDNLGRFKFQNLPKGNYNLTIEHIVYGIKDVSISLNKNLYQSISLDAKVTNLNTVVIKAKKQTFRNGVHISTLSKDVLEKYSSGSLGDALEEVVGASSLKTGNTIVKPVINGLHSSRVIVNVDGVRLHNHEWGVEHAPNIDVNSFDKITVTQGVDALRYGGDAIGGVVNLDIHHHYEKDTVFGSTIVTQQLNPRGFNVSSNFNSYFADHFFIKTTATLKRFGDANTSNYSLTNTGLNSKSFNFTSGFQNEITDLDLFYSYSKNNIGILRASHIGSVSDLVNAINLGKPAYIRPFSFDINYPKQDESHHIFKTHFVYDFSDIGKLDMQYDYQKNHRLEFDIRRGRRKHLPVIDLFLETHSLASHFSFDKSLTGKSAIDIGFSGRYQNNFVTHKTKTKRLIPNYFKHEFGLHAIHNYSVDKFIINSGLRYDYSFIDTFKYYYISKWNLLDKDGKFANNVIKKIGVEYLTQIKQHYHNFSGSLGVKYNFMTNGNLLLNYAVTTRAPNPSELFSEGLHHSAARMEMGNFNIDTEKSHRVGATFIFSNNVFSSNIELYSNFINDYIYLEPTGTNVTIRGVFPVYTYKQTNAQLSGVNFRLQIPIIECLAFENKTAFMIGSNRSDNTALVNMPPLNITNGLQYRNVNWYDFSAQLKSQFIARQFRYPNNNFESYVPSLDKMTLVDVSRPTPSYHLLHFNTAIAFELSKTKVKVGLSVNNILNTAYRDYLNRFRFYADDLGRNLQLQLKVCY